MSAVTAGDIAKLMPADRHRHTIPLEKLVAYIEQHVPQIKLPVEVKQFKFGQRQELLAAARQRPRH
jgi:hypothetical protein